MASIPETTPKSATSATDVQDNSTTSSATTQVETKPANGAAAAGDAAQQNVNVTGRSVFAVETTAAGVVVRTAFLTEENRLLGMPAVFPNMMYAMNVIDDLRRQVMQHFSQAAQVGAQVIANQARAQQEQGQQQGQQQAGASDSPKA
jgi:hypothetical protein